MPSNPPAETVEADAYRSDVRKAVSLKLVVLEGPDAGRELALDNEVTVGAERECDLVLRDPSVSRKHLRVTPLGGRILVQDLNSRNGTYLDGTRLKEAEVPLGAVLRLGRTALSVHSRFYVREVAPSAAREFGGLFAESIAMREIFAVLERVAPTNVTVLVEGESGTGKELVARAIHGASPRAKGPYVVFDCGSVPSELAESELFGHRKGSFSGASGDRLGAFQQAHGGTLCLDELGELPLDLQPKLLRVLETSEVRPVGEDTPRQVDVRVVASTNRDLAAESRRGQFRSDLLYRLEVVKLRLPPLRHRPEDIPGLVARLLRNEIRPGDTLEGENMSRLMNYSWPGNVRELRNVLLRALTLGRTPGKPAPLFKDFVFNLGPTASGPLTIGAEFPGVARPALYKEAKAQLLHAFDSAYVAALMERHHDNILQAASAAGLSRKHLYELVRRVGEGAPDSGE